MSEPRIVAGWRWGAGAGPFVEGPQQEIDDALAGLDELEDQSEEADVKLVGESGDES